MVGKEPSTATEPVKFIFTIFTILFSPIKFLYLSIAYLNPALRPHRSWSYRLAISNEITRSLFDFWSKTRTQQPRIRKQGERDPIVTIPPAPAELHRGPLLQPSVVATPVNAVWHHHHAGSASTPDLSRGHTIVHFHGGAFVFLSPQDRNVADGLQTLASSMPECGLLAPEYRLASRPGCAFPAQLHDALSAYAYLLHDLGLPASRIILSGDSAGAHMVISLLRYLHVYAVLPLPAAALLHSPWLNLSAEGCVVETNANRGTDFVTTAFLQWGAQSFTPDGMRRDAEWISPLFHPFDCHVPLWVQDGTAEVLHADIVTWIERMREAGVQIEYYGAEAMVHNLLHVARFMGLERERTASLLSAKAFVKSLSL